MKFSETPPTLHQERITIINNRWKQLYDLASESGKGALQYLFLINAGGAATTLAFIGTVGAAKIGLGPKISLAIFVAGVILLGIGKAKTVHKMDSHFERWKALVREYFGDKISYEDMMRVDNEKSGDDFWDYVFPYASFGCFIIGSIIGFRSLL